MGRSDSSIRKAAGRRKFLKVAGGAGITVGVVGCLGDGNGNGDGEPVDLTMASFDEGTAWYVMVSTIGERVTDYLPQGSQVSVRPFGGSEGSISLLRDGDADTAVNHPVTTQWATNSEEIFEDEEPVTEMRGIAGHLDTYWTMIGVKQEFADEYGFETYEEMREAEPPIRLGLGPEGGVSNQGTEMELEAHGITFDDIEDWGGSLEYMNLGDMPQAMQANQIDANGWVATSGHPTWTEIGTNEDLLFMPSTDEAMDEMIEQGWMEMPPMEEGTFESEHEVPSVGWRTTLVTTTDLDHEVGYALAQVIVEDIDTLVDAYAAMEVYDPDLGATEEYLGVELHEGAREYYEDAGIL